MVARLLPIFRAVKVDTIFFSRDASREKTQRDASRCVFND
jgi:hypothetical protein